MLEFRAGKMLLEGKRVVPDARKGLVRIARVCLLECCLICLLCFSILLDGFDWLMFGYFSALLCYFIYGCYLRWLLLYQGEEGLVHFQWLDRTLNVLEDVSFFFSFYCNMYNCC